MEIWEGTSSVKKNKKKKKVKNKLTKTDPIPTTTQRSESQPKPTRRCKTVKSTPCSKTSSAPKPQTTKKPASASSIAGDAWKLVTIEGYTQVIRTRKVLRRPKTISEPADENVVRAYHKYLLAVVKHQHMNITLANVKYANKEQGHVLANHCKHLTYTGENMERRVMEIKIVDELTQVADVLTENLHTLMESRDGGDMELAIKQIASIRKVCKTLSHKLLSMRVSLPSEQEYNGELKDMFMAIVSELNKIDEILQHDHSGGKGIWDLQLETAYNDLADLVHSVKIRSMKEGRNCHLIGIDIK